MCGYRHPCFLHGGIVTSEREINSIDSLYNNLTENIGNGYILYSLLIELLENGNALSSFTFKT